jgi:hypothetical protein
MLCLYLKYKDLLFNIQAGLTQRCDLQRPKTLKTVPNNSSIQYFINNFLKNTTFDVVKTIKKGLQT